MSAHAATPPPAPAAEGARARNLTERVFLRMWERPMDFDPERGPLRVLLCELARQWAVEHVRREGRPAVEPKSGDLSENESFHFLRGREKEMR